MSDTGGNFKAVNPATGEELEPAFKEATTLDVITAMAGAWGGFEHTQTLEPGWQAALLDEVAKRIMELGDALLERGELETALPRARLTAERARTVNQLKMFAEIVREGSWVEAVIDTADPKRQPMPRPDLRRMLKPRGPVVIFGASNFPFAFGAVGGDTASALAAGNPVVVKGHPSHPGTSKLFAGAVSQAIEQRALPKGLFTLLQGRAHELSAQLVKHPVTAAVGFTGSLRAGRALFDIAAARPVPIPVYAEMGSVNPIVILPGAAAERGETIAQQLAGSVLLGGGQFCTKPGLIFMVGRDDDFVQALAKHIQSAAPATMLNRQLRESFCGRVATLSQAPGVRTLVSGSATGNATMSPVLMETDASNWRSNKALHEEAFGPGALVVRCDNVEEAIDAIDHLDGNLTGSVHIGAADGSDLPRRVVAALEARVGRVIVNGYPTGVEVNNAIVHGGPYPATTDPNSTSVGSAALRRYVRMVSYQDVPDGLLPAALQNANPLGIERVVNGQRTRDPI